MLYFDYQSHWAILDIDGTISDCSARVHLAHAAKEELRPELRMEKWDAFHAECLNDPPYAGEVLICRAWLQCGGRLAYITGRHDKWRVHTQTWLLRNALPTSYLFMRDDWQYASSLEYKAASLQRIQKMMHPDDTIAWIMEDQDALVAAWRAMGLTCLQPRHSVFGDTR